MSKRKSRNPSKRPENRSGQVRAGHEPHEVRDVRKARTPAVIKAYSGSGFHTPGKYGTAERRAAGREIEGERD